MPLRAGKPFYTMRRCSSLTDKYPLTHYALLCLKFFPAPPTLVAGGTHKEIFTNFISSWPTKDKEKSQQPQEKELSNQTAASSFFR